MKISFARYCLRTKALFLRRETRSDLLSSGESWLSAKYFYSPILQLKKQLFKNSARWETSLSSLSKYDKSGWFWLTFAHLNATRNDIRELWMLQWITYPFLLVFGKVMQKKFALLFHLIFFVISKALFVDILRQTCST